MFGFKSKEQKAQERYEAFSKKQAEQERFDTLQDNLKVLNEQQDRSKVVLEEIYHRHGIMIYIPSSTDTLIEQAYLDDDVIDDLCIFTEEERKSLHKWAKVYKDCESVKIMKLLEYKKAKLCQSINS